MVRKRSRSRFPDPRTAGEDGLLCIGGDLDVDTLVEAYSCGVFPWPHEGQPLLWFSPEKRGVVDFEDVHWPTRFLREMKSRKRQITFDQAFREVIEKCAKVPRTRETGTWILPEMIEAYVRLFEAGHAHSVECWHGDSLVGGLYGVYIGGVFSGESMFFGESNASKRCLYALIQHLQASGLEWMDIQMVTPVLQTIGGKYVSRNEYIERVRTAQMSPPRINW